MVSTSLMVDTIPVLSRRNILCAVNCALTEDPTWVYGHRHSRFNGFANHRGFSTLSANCIGAGRGPSPTSSPNCSTPSVPIQLPLIWC